MGSECGLGYKHRLTWHKVEIITMEIKTKCAFSMAMKNRHFFRENEQWMQVFYQRSYGAAGLLRDLLKRL
jgi:hypothetical protein